MSDSKPFASLTSGLLARKGFAKPAMRPQSYAQQDGQDDLGWNDMGQGYRPTIPSPDPVAGLTRFTAEPEPQPAPEPAAAPDEIVSADVVPPVCVQRAAMAEELGAPVEPGPVPATEAPRATVVSIDAGRGRDATRARSAFTLRLDPERHLRLRLACAVDHRSAQQIVTQALDEFLGKLPEIDELAGRVPARASRQV